MWSPMPVPAARRTVRLALQLLLALGVFAAVPLVRAPAASATVYATTVCSQSANDSSAFVIGDEGSTGLTTTNNCGTNSGDVQQSSTGLSNTGAQHWVMSAPDGTSIQVFSAERVFLRVWTSTLPFMWDLRTREGIFLDSATASNLGTPTSIRKNYAVLSSAVIGRLHCPLASCNSQAGIALRNIVVALDDQFAPDPPSMLAGSLVSGGPISGIAQVTFHAHDRGAGVAEYHLVLDGAAFLRVADTNGGTCQLGHLANLVPCKLDLDGSLTLDTTNLLDGPHRIKVAIVDGAGQRTDSAEIAITTHNPPIGTAPPLITGVATLGAPLNASSGMWTGSPTRFAYQWLRCPAAATAATVATSCTPISGATTAHYVLTSADVYQRVAVQVTATNVTTASAAATSAPTALVPDAQGRTAPPGTGTGTNGSGDHTAPVLSAVSLTRARFRVARTPTAIAAALTRIARGTVLRLTSSEAGRLTISIERARPGRKVRKSGKLVCTAVRRAVRRGRCTLYRRTATLTRTINAGAASIALSGRIRTKPMTPGSYRLTITVRDAAGNVSKATRRTFTIVPG